MKPIRWFRRSLASALNSAANFVGWSGAYNSTDLRRKLLDGWRLSKTTSNQALGTNLQTLIDQSRQLERTSPIARAVIEGMKADIIGTGIDVEPDTGNPDLNKRIRQEWTLWAEASGVDGTPLWEIQQMAVAEWANAGAILHRYVTMPERLEQGHLPVAILPLEPEWLSPIPVQPLPDGTHFVYGKVLDRLGRVLFYDLQDPNGLNGGYATGLGERVPADQICHGYEKRRAFQAQGEPVLATVIERIKQCDDLISIELQAAKATAAPAVAIMSQLDPGYTTDSGESVTDIPAGATVRLQPGETIESIENKRPNQLIEQFIGAMIGSIAASTRTARKWLTKDYSSATYMNARMEQLDSTRQQKPIQQWIGRHVASYPYERVLPWILMRLGVPLPADPVMRRQLFRHKLMPDSPPYVDPLKDGQAAIQNIGANLSTLEAECAARGLDYRKVQEQRLHEEEERDQANVDRIAAVNAAIAKAKEKDPTLSLDWSQLITLGGASSAPGASPSASVSAPAPAQADQTPTPEQNIANQKEADVNIREVQEIMRTTIEMYKASQPAALPAPAPGPAYTIHTDMRAEAIREVMSLMKAPVVNVTTPAVQVDVNPTPVHIDGSNVRVQFDQQPAPIVNVAAPIVNVAAPEVTVENTVEVPARTIKATPQRDGSVLMVPQE